MTTKAFHLTTDSSLEAILAEGRKPVIGERSEDFGEATPRIYLFPTEDDLESALGSWLGESFEEDDVLHVLEVDVTGLNLQSEVDWELTCETAIESTRLTYLREE